MQSPTSLLTSLVAELGAQPTFVDRTYGEPLFHTDSEILAIRYGADGTVWTIEEIGVARHWSADGRLLSRSFLSDAEDIWTFNGPATLLASGSNDLALWDVATGEELNRELTESWVTSLAFSPDGQILVSGHDDGRLCFWKLPELTQIGQIDAHTDSVTAVSFSADSTQLTSAGDDHRLRTWNTADRQMIRESVGHTDRVPALAWHPSGEYLVSVGWDTTARVWAPNSNEPSVLLNAHSDQVTALAFSPDGGLLACADSDFTIHVWDDPRNAKQKFVMSGHTDEIRCLAFDPTGTRLASAGADRVVHIWDVTTGKLVAGPNPSARNSVAVHGNTVYSSAGTRLQAWDRDSGDRAWPTDSQDEVHFVAVSQDGKLVAASGPSPTVNVWDTETKTIAYTLPHTRGPIGSPVFSPDGTMLATCSVSDGLIWLWKFGQPDAILVIPEAADNSTLEAMAFHPNGKYVAVGGYDWLATSGSDGALCIWDLEARDKFLTFEAGVTSLAFDRAGKYLAAGTIGQNGQSVVVWDMEKEERIFDLPGHHDRINAVAFSPDGSWLASASDDCTIRIWNVLTGRLAVARQFDAALQSLSFSADGEFLFTGNGNTTCYRLEISKLLEE